MHSLCVNIALLFGVSHKNTAHTTQALINFQMILNIIISQTLFIPIGLNTIKCFSVSTFMHISTFAFLLFPTEFDLKNKTSQMVLAVIFVFLDDCPWEGRFMLKMRSKHNKPLSTMHKKSQSVTNNHDKSTWKEIQLKVKAFLRQMVKSWQVD